MARQPHERREQIDRPGTVDRGGEHGGVDSHG
jgi:hypothetical protein